MAIIDKKGFLHGSVANTVYRSYGEKQVIQIKPSRVKQTVKSKEASFEFGLASSTSRAIRHAFGNICPGYDGRMNNRLNGAVRKCIAGSDKKRGERGFHDADLSHLIGFQFNANSPLDVALPFRPLVDISPEWQLRATLPPVSIRDIRGPNCQEYIIRLVAIAFDFRQEVYNYVGYRDIRINHTNPFEGGDVMLELAAISGRVLFTSMSIHGYNDDGFGGSQSVNSKAWSPAAIIAGWHIAESSHESPPAIDDIPMAYSGNDSLRAINKLKEKKEPRAGSNLKRS